MDTKGPPKKKRQHYVPRFVLRKYTHDEKLTNVFIVDSRRLVNNISIVEQCYGDYFYGKGGHVEDFFAGIETKTASILNKKEFEDINAEDMKLLRFYIFSQRIRTMGAARESDEMFNDLYTDTMKTFGKLNNISEAYLPSIKSRDSQFLMLENIAYLEPIMLDMKIKFLINNTSQKFILSDDPVVVHNQFAENHPRFKNALNTAGLAVRGLQMFFPVSPTLCIAMYDPGRYEYGKKNGQICTVSELDVSRLNLLQVLNTDRCIYSLPGSYTQEQLTTLADLGQNYAPHAPRVESSELVEAPGGGYTQTVLTIAHYIRTGFKFSFVRVIDSERYSDHPPNIVPVRSPFNIELSHAWKDKLQKQYMKQAQTETQAIHDPDQAAKVVQPSGFQKEGDQ